MKKSNSELMKELKAIQYEIAELVARSKEESKVTYYEGEEVERNFDYEKFMGELASLRKEEAKIKGILTVSNASTKLIGMEEMTISEGLIKLAQLNQDLEVVSSMKSNTQKKTEKHYASFEGDTDRVQYVECLYDIEKVRDDIKKLQHEISHLQITIDRTNLCNLIDC